MASAKTSGGGFDLATLAITAAASAGAAYACSMVWAPGTLASAAFTPVLVALLKEALWRPTEVVTRAVPVRGVVRSATGPSEPPGPIEPVDPVADRVAQQGEIPGRSPRRRRGWRLAIVTGLLGFLVAAVVITLPEFVAGQAATGGGRDTTLFGGREEESSKPETTTTTTTTTTAPAQTVTVTPAETVTVPAPAQTTTAPPTTTTPAETTPMQPGQTAPVPPQAPEPVPPPPG